MTDRELLEDAAKAAGMVVDKSPFNGGGSWNTGFDVIGNAVLDWHNGKTWNPLTDDGDEARLEAALQMHVEWHPATETVTVGTAEIACTEPYGNNRQAARKRAGVRAAAAIGAAQ